MSTHSSLPFALLLASTLAAGCAAEEGFTPIGDEQQDQGGAVFNLDKDTDPSGTIFFECEELAGCDIQLNIGFFGEAPDVEGLNGVTALQATLTRPDGFSRKDALIFGADNQFIEDGVVGWISGFAGVEAGQYLVTVELDQIQQATITAGARLDPTVLSDWDFQGLDCSESSAVCQGNTFCAEGLDAIGTVVSTCTSECAFDAQCASGLCDGFCIN